MNKVVAKGSDSSLSGHPEAKPALRSVACDGAAHEEDRLRLPVPNLPFNLHDTGKELFKVAKGEIMELAALR